MLLLLLLRWQLALGQWERVRAALGVYKVVIKKRRAATGARVMQQLQQRLTAGPAARWPKCTYLDFLKDL